MVFLRSSFEVEISSPNRVTERKQKIDLFRKCFNECNPSVYPSSNVTVHLHRYGLLLGNLKNVKETFYSSFFKIQK